MHCARRLTRTTLPTHYTNRRACAQPNKRAHARTIARVHTHLINHHQHAQTKQRAHAHKLRRRCTRDGQRSSRTEVVGRHFRAWAFQKRISDTYFLLLKRRYFRTWHINAVWSGVRNSVRRRILRREFLAHFNSWLFWVRCRLKLHHRVRQLFLLNECEIALFGMVLYCGVHAAPILARFTARDKAERAQRRVLFRVLGKRLVVTLRAKVQLKLQTRAAMLLLCHRLLRMCWSHWVRYALPLSGYVKY